MCLTACAISSYSNVEQGRDSAHLQIKNVLLMKLIRHRGRHYLSLILH